MILLNKIKIGTRPKQAEKYFVSRADDKNILKKWRIINPFSPEIHNGVQLSLWGLEIGKLVMQQVENYLYTRKT